MSDINGKSFRIGSVDYNVKEVDGLHSDGQNLYGLVTYGLCLIQIDSASSDTRKRNILIHEIVHAILFEAGIEEQDEDLVNRLGHVLAQVLRDNDFEFMKEVTE